MLVLGRREGEQVVIEAGSQRIVVEVCRIGGGAVRIGFDADPSVRIYREEVLERKEDERK